MVRSVSNLSRSGLSDWLIQRATAVILAAYVLFIMIAACPSGGGYEAWQALFSKNSVKVFSILALLSLAAHAWIGMWTIITDYIKPPAIRLAITVAVILANLAYVAWGILIVWGV